MTSVKKFIQLNIVFERWNTTMKSSRGTEKNIPKNELDIKFYRYVFFLPWTTIFEHCRSEPRVNWLLKSLPTALLYVGIFTSSWIKSWMILIKFMRTYDIFFSFLNFFSFSHCLPLLRSLNAIWGVTHTWPMLTYDIYFSKVLSFSGPQKKEIFFFVLKISKGSQNLFYFP